MALRVQKQHSLLRAIAKPTILLTTVLLLAVVATGFGNYARAAGQVYPVSGTLNGTMSGKGTILGFVPVSANTEIKGTFTGDTSHGDLAAAHESAYDVPSMSAKGTVTGDVKGQYNLSIDSSGVITGDGTVPFTGDVTGELKLVIKGQESATGEVKGTWTGVLTVTGFMYKGSLVAPDLKLEGGGEFEGKETRGQASATETTTVAPPATTTATVPTTSEATTAQPLTTTGGAPPENVPYVTYGIIAVIVVVILAAVFALRSRGKKKS
jgi:cytoskeletal protein CcmA (bactofilin family)